MYLLVDGPQSSSPQLLLHLFLLLHEACGTRFCLFLGALGPCAVLLTHIIWKLTTRTDPMPNDRLSDVHVPFLFRV